MYITAFHPQLQFLAETALGDQLDAQRRGWETAWSLIFTALWIGIAPLPATLPNPRPQMPWVDATRELQAMLEIDKFLCVMGRKRRAFVEEAYDENCLHASLWEVNLKWMRDSLSEFMPLKTNCPMMALTGIVLLQRSLM